MDGPLVLHFQQIMADGYASVGLLRGTGSIGLIAQDGAVTGVWDMADTAVTIRGDQLTIDPGHVLAPGSYVLQIAGPVVTDLNGQPLPLRYDVNIPLTTTTDGGHVMWPFMGDADGTGTNDVAVLDGKAGDFTFEREGDDLLASGPQ